MRRYAYFLNPFEVTERGRDSCVQNELLIAGVPALAATFKGEHRSEFRDSILGVLWFASGEAVGFSRGHSHWCVNSSAPLPHAQAEALNDRMSDIVRMYGMSGGTTKVRMDGCANWHVDAQEGLNALVQALKDHFGRTNETQYATTAMLVNMGLVHSAIYE